MAQNEKIGKSLQNPYQGELFYPNSRKSRTIE